MGKQFDLFATPEDELVLYEAITSQLGGVFVKTAFLSQEDMKVVAFPNIDSIPPRHLLFLLYCPSIPHSLEINIYKTGVHSINNTDSLVIEFERSRIIGEVIFAGRMWYEPVRQNGTDKPSAFLLWANDIFSWIGSHYTLEQSGSILRYFGPDAWKRLQEGSLVQP